MLLRPRRHPCIRRPRAALAVVLALTAPGAASAAEPPPLQVVLSDSAVGVGGLAPGGAVAWLGAGRQPLGAGQRLVVARRVTVDATGAGEAYLDLAPVVPSSGGFVAVDLATGALGWAGPEGAELAVLELPGVAFGGPAGLSGLPGPTGGEAAALRLPHGWLEVLLVRPGAGAWGLRLADGAPADADGAADGWVEALFAALEPVEGIESAGLPEIAPVPPATLAPGDVVVAVDLDGLVLYAVRIGGAS